METSFAVRVAIDTPISLRGLLHLDGLLGALAVARGGGPHDNHLATRHGIALASAAILEVGVFGFAVSVQTRLKHIVPDSVPHEILGQLRGSERRTGGMSRTRAALAPYQVIEGVRAVWFVAQGDMAGVLDLMQDAKNLGAMGKTGYGRVTDLTGMLMDHQELSGIVLAQGLPARAVPVYIWKELGLASPEEAIVSVQRTIPPYWIGPEELCFSPMQIDLSGTQNEIRSLIGCG